MQRPRLALGGLLAAAGLLACTPAQVTQQQEPASQPAVQAGPEGRGAEFNCTPGQEWWRAQGTPKRGGTFVFGANANRFDNLDPTAGGSYPESPHVYEGLLQKRGCWDDDTEVAPRLAKSWEVSPDGLTWTLKLRDDVKWQDLPPVNGRQFTSADVAWSIDWHQQKGVSGVYWKDVAVETPDAYTVVLRLKQPNVDFPNTMAEQLNVMLPHEIADRDGNFKSLAIGTGSFMVKEFKGTDYVLAERNPNFREKGADGRPLPYLDATRQTIFADYSAEIAAFRSKQLDRTRTIGIARSDAETLEKAVPGSRHTTQWVAGFGFISFNMQKAPWNDVRVRQAINLAINRDDLIATNQGAAVWAGFIPKVFGEYAWSQQELETRFRYDPEQARKLLADAGYQLGSIKGTITTATAYQQDAEVVQQQLKAIGIETAIEVQGQNFLPIFQNKQYPDMAYGQRGGNYWPGFWAYDWVYSSSTRNFLGWGDPQVDELALAQLKEQDRGRRKQILDREQSLIYDQMPFVPTVTRVWDNMWSCRIRNLSPHNYGWPGIDVAWIDEAGC